MSFIPILLGIAFGVPLTIYLGKTFIDNNDKAQKKYNHLIGTSLDEARSSSRDITLVNYPCGLPPNMASAYTQSRINVKTDKNNVITEIVSCG
ncbi:MAG: hypothetical protein Terrestrivirus1_309 [Terrestrivirus sp.]|uniref:Peptidase inhibitor I78 family protein n=1 Tax=Terrestrivirus sp. TaxID=2487775 RepID=A0A3G4ZKS4_9VIRU|nr:MAG: hypothetical protein Terrestrivirus1_309 [Terrestrivirus sp.]